MHAAKIYWLEFRSEFLKMLRLPAYVIPTLTFPLVFYAFFGLAMARHNSAAGLAMPSYLIATYGAFGVIGASLFGFGVAVATERGQGWLQVKRASPMPIGAWFVAKIGMAALFSSIIVTGLSILGSAFGNVQFSASQWAGVFAALVFGALPFCAMGLAIGYLAGPNSAPAIVNIIYLPMSIVSGLWIPVNVLPKMLRGIAPFLPAYHLAQLALGTLGAAATPLRTHVVALASFTVFFLVIAAAAYRRDEGKLYG